jgi:hypothetical protein
MRRVLWVLLLLLGNGLLPASCVVHARRAQTQNTNFYFQTETFRLVPVVVECVSCLSYTSLLLFLVSLFVFRHVSNTVAVKPIYTSVIDCDDFVMCIEFRLQWWVGFYSPLSSLLHPMRGAYWISGGALQKGKKATEPSVQFDNRFLWIAGFSFCIGVVCGACMLVTVIFLYFLLSA